MVARTSGAINAHHPEKYLQGQAGLYRGVTEVLLAATLSARRRHPIHIRVKPNR